MKLLAKKFIRPDITMDAEEFKKSYLGFKNEGKYASKKDIKNLEKKFSTTSFLEIFHSKSKGGPLSNYCTATDPICDKRLYSDSCESRIQVEDQGGCGSCWVFAGLQHLEIFHCMHSGKDTIYSKQQLLDCSPKDCVSGGSYSFVYKTLLLRGRISDAKSYPYEFDKKECKDDKSNVWTGTYPSAYIPNRFNRIKLGYGIDEWIDFMKKYIVYLGSIYVFVRIDEDFRFSTDVIYICSPKQDKVTHALLITGWTIKNSIPVWIVRNSWGVWWGFEGYANIAMKNDDCAKELDPFIEFVNTGIVDWSDKISEYKVIETHTQQERDIFEKKRTVARGGNIILVCLHSKIMQIKESVVISYEGSTSNKLLCEELKVKEKCENKAACQIFFNSDMCEKGYDLLLVRFRCTPIQKNYECGHAKSISPDTTDSMCITFCYDAAKNCAPVTKECLCDQIDKKMCDLKDVVAE